MRSVGSGQSIVDVVHIAAVCVCLALAVVSAACSIPNLEAPECTAARGTVRELFSYHFGNDMYFSPDNLAAREKFLTPEFAAALKSSTPGSDPFTLTREDDPPKAFRVGTCEASASKASVQVLLFWKTDTRSEQRELNAEVVKQGENWLVNGISNR
jgi:hypothetical protein